MAIEATLKMTLKHDTTAQDIIEFLGAVPASAKISVTEYKTYNAREQDPATITARWTQ